MSLLHSLWLVLAASGSAILAIFYTHARSQQQDPEKGDVDCLRESISLTPIAPPQSQETAPVATSKPIDRVYLCAKSQEAFEGYYLPGSTHNGVHYPEGSASYSRKNPGNIKQRNPDGSTSFIVFATYEEGFAALENYIRRVATGKHLAYPKGGATKIMEYAHIFTGDPEPSPTNYGLAIADAVGLSASAPMSALLP